jgi:PAP2 superfamily
MKAQNPFRFATLLIGAAALQAPVAHADVITDWNLKSAELITESKIGTPPAVRVMAQVQMAADCAVNTITRRLPPLLPQLEVQRSASVEAAVAAAHRATFVRLLPAVQASADAAYKAALGSLPEGADKTAGVAVGERCAADVATHRANDGAGTPEQYRPFTTPGTWVPTAAAAVPQWPQRQPWLMSSAAQMRPAAPPALGSEAWARDFNEIKSLGARNSTARSTDQTDAARFWDYSLPAIYHGVLRSAALQPGREVSRNARLFALVAVAMDDALIAVFDAKYQYGFWRPVTAIRNADIDGNELTQRDPAWLSLIDAPMHPEYPSGHAILASSMATVLKADFGGEAMPLLSTSSPTGKPGLRTWSRPEDFVREIGDARIWGGIHYRSAVDTGVEMGRRIGELAAARLKAAR